MHVHLLAGHITLRDRSVGMRRLAYQTMIAQRHVLEALVGQLRIVQDAAVQRVR